MKSKKHHQKEYLKVLLNTSDVTCTSTSLMQQTKFVTLHWHMHNMWLTHLKYIIIEEHHYDTGNVEWWKTRVNDEVAVVEEASIWYSIRCIIQSQNERSTYRCWYHPYEGYCQPYSSIVFVFCVFNWLSYCDVPEMKEKVSLEIYLLIFIRIYFILL